MQLKHVIVPLRGRCDARLRKWIRVRWMQKFHSKTFDKNSGGSYSLPYERQARVSPFCRLAVHFDIFKTRAKGLARVSLCFQRFNDLPRWQRCYARNNLNEMSDSSVYISFSDDTKRVIRSWAWLWYTDWPNCSWEHIFRVLFLHRIGEKRSEGMRSIEIYARVR